MPHTQGFPCFSISMWEKSARSCQFGMGCHLCQNFLQDIYFSGWAFSKSLPLWCKSHHFDTWHLVNPHLFDVNPHHFNAGHLVNPHCFCTSQWTFSKPPLVLCFNLRYKCSMALYTMKHRTSGGLHCEAQKQWKFIKCPLWNTSSGDLLKFNVHCEVQK